MALSLVSLNVERCKHEARNLPWLRRERPEVICLQEMLASRVDRYANALGMHARFVPMAYADSSRADPDGLCLMTRADAFVSVVPLYGAFDALPVHDPDDQTTNVYALVTAQFQHEGAAYRVSTTHLPKSWKGSETTKLQRQIRDTLREETAQYDELILCGDFNAPRGYEIFESIAARYRDNIPAHYTTSIDNDLHYAGQQKLQYVIDVLFTTPQYAAHDVEYVCGLSDHCAVRAQIARAA